MAKRVTRHFVNVDGRRVHYTRAGEGPPVVLLHASPVSGKAMSLPQEVFAANHTVLAFDNPGFGLSDLLPLEQPEIGDFADGLAKTLDALGIEQTAVYGRHTGAAIGVEFAKRYPERCSLALSDGFPLWASGVAEDRIRSYLTPIVPTWDGGHLTWIWLRYRDQFVFWPWNGQSADKRADQDVPDLDFIQRGASEFLEAGDGYRIGYAAAFRYKGLETIPQVKVPACYGNRPGDSQFKTMSMYPADAWTVEIPREAYPAAVAEREILAKHPASGTLPSPTPCDALPDRTTLDYVDLDDSQILVRRFGVEDSRIALVLLPDLPGSTALHDDLIVALGRHRPVIALDPPGHGESVAAPGSEQTVEAWASRVVEALDRLGVRRFHLLGMGTGSTLAVEVAHRVRSRVASLILNATPALPSGEGTALASRYAPSILPEWDGTHMARLWHHLRDQELWWPWFDRRRASMRSNAYHLGAEELTARVREIMKHPANYQPAWEAVLSYPFLGRLAALSIPAVLTAGQGDLFARFLDNAAEVCPGAPVLRTADTARERAAAILSHLPG